MRHHPRWFRYAVLLLLPCCLLGGPLAPCVWSAVCPHHHAMQHHPGACYCDRMAIADSLDMVGPVVLPVPVPTEVVATQETIHILGPTTSRHDSPSYPPRHPPPKTPIV